LGTPPLPETTELTAPLPETTEVDTPPLPESTKLDAPSPELDATPLPERPAPLKPLDLPLHPTAIKAKYTGNRASAR
jgi:hypothetical protein